MIKRILVALDFSELSRRAAAYAIEQLAPQLGAEVTLASVLEVSDLRVAMRAGLHGFETNEEVRESVRRWVDEQFSDIESHKGNAAVKRDIRRGDPERQLVDAIRELQPDLIVMGAAGMGRRAPIGSKTEFVIREVDVPLLLIHDRE
jgi:nucleotide-binding universal stress UspA family protein